jgi:hypothetical protein
MNSSTLVPDALWEAIEPLLPKKPPNPEGGRPQVPDRAALGGIVFVLRTGCPWRLLPKELACDSGTTCWRRLRDWQEAGERRYPERPGQKGASRPARTGSTGANPAPSTTWLSIGTAFPWPFTSRRPMSTTRPTCCPWSTRFPQSLALGEARSSSQAPRQAARRHGARFLGAATCPAGPRHHNALGAAGDRLQRATRTVPLGGGADALLAP